MCSWQSIKITASEESLINTLLNLLEGKICNGKSNSGHKMFCKGGRKKAFPTWFLPCCVKRGGTARGRVLHPSPVHHPSPLHHPLGLPTFSWGLNKGYCLHPHSFVLHWPCQGGNCVNADRVGGKKPQLMDSGWGRCPGSITQPAPAELRGFTERASG